MNERARGRLPAASAGGRDRILCMRKEGCARDDRGDGHARAGPERTDRGTIERITDSNATYHTPRALASRPVRSFGALRGSRRRRRRVYNVQKRILVNLFLGGQRGNGDDAGERQDVARSRDGPRVANARCSLLAARRRSTRWDGSAQQRRPRPLGRDIQPLFIVI